MVPGSDVGPSFLTDIAHAIARNGRALQIGEDNDSGRWMPIRDAATAGLCAAVELRPSVLAVDADRPEHHHVIGHMASALEGEGFRPVVVASGRPGHAHLFCLIPDSGTHRRFSGNAAVLGFDVRRCIRPPLWPHRSGFPVRLLEPATPHEALEYLRSNGSLSARARRLLRQGDVASEFHSRSELVMSIIVSAIRGGWSLGSILDALVDPANLGGMKVQEIARNRGRKAAWSWTALSFQRGERFLAQQPQPQSAWRDERPFIQGIRSRVHLRNWIGSGGATDRDVLLAHLKICGRMGRLTHRASVREVAEGANVAAATVSRAQRRLQRAGWLILEEKGAARRSSVWTVSSPLDDADETIVSHPPEEECTGDVVSTHDLFVFRRGLGKATGLVYEAIVDRPRTVRELADDLERTARTIQRHVRRLAKYDLIERRDLRWQRASRSLDSVAFVVGADGSRDRRRRRHAEDRVRHDEYLERLASRTREAGHLSS